MERPRKRVLVTGAEGLIGTAVRRELGDRYELVSLTLTPQDFPTWPTSLTSGR